MWATETHGKHGFLQLLVNQVSVQVTLWCRPENWFPSAVMFSLLSLKSLVTCCVCCDFFWRPADGGAAGFRWGKLWWFRVADCQQRRVQLESYNKTTSSILHLVPSPWRVIRTLFIIWGLVKLLWASRKELRSPIPFQVRSPIVLCELASCAEHWVVENPLRRTQIDWKGLRAAFAKELCPQLYTIL